MTDQSTSQPAASTIPPQAPTPRRRRRRIFDGLLFLLVAGVTGGIAGKAVSGGYSHGFGHGFGHRMMGPIDPARIEERADRMVRHLVVEIDASYEQQDKLRAVVKSAVRDLVPLAEKAQFARREGRALLTQPNLDRGMIEKFRTDQLSLADTFSKRVAQAFGDAAEILTPEQRRKIEDRLPARGGYWEWRHRG
jgi:periplasmic protein CpxP/Spy